MWTPADSVWSSHPQANPRKIDRAIQALRKENKEITEEAVLELYTKWGGFVIDETTAEETAPEVVEQVKRRRAKK